MTHADLSFFICQQPHLKEETFLYKIKKKKNRITLRLEKGSGRQWKKSRSKKGTDRKQA